MIKIEIVLTILGVFDPNGSDKDKVEIVKRNIYSRVEDITRDYLFTFSRNIWSKDSKIGV